MKNPLDKLLAIACLGLASIAVPAQASTYTFSQSGFEDGGVVTGYFTGSDLNSDGSIVMQGTQREVTDFSLRYTGGSRMPDIAMGFDDLLRSLAFGVGQHYVVGSSTIGAGPSLDDGLLYVFDFGSPFIPVSAVRQRRDTTQPQHAVTDALSAEQYRALLKSLHRLCG